ncbi:hypothetical protein VWQ03_22630, partial [Xanthomonas citri pv. citri]
PEEPEMSKPVLVPAEPTPSAPLPTIIPAASPPAGPGADAVSTGMASAAVPASGEREARRTA